MDRRTQIERIITGSLIACFRHYWPEVRSSIDHTMMQDPTCRRLLKRMEEMNAEGTYPDIITLTEGATADEGNEIAELAINCDFYTKRWQYYIGQKLSHKPMVDSEFGQYITRLIQYELARQKQDPNRRTAQHAT